MSFSTNRDKNTGILSFEIDLIDASGGINDRDDPREIADNEATIERNVLVGRRGSAKKRTGYDRVTTNGTAGYPRGMMKYIRTGYKNQKFLLIFQNGKVFTLDSTWLGWVEAGTYGADQEATVRGEVFGNQAVFGNGVDVTKRLLMRSKYLGGTSTTTLGQWQAVTDGRFRIVIGGVPYDISGVDLHLCADLDAVAAAVQAKIRTATGGTTETVTHSTSPDIFTITTDEEITELTTIAGGTDISGLGTGDFLSGRDHEGGLGDPIFTVAFTLADLTGAPRTNVFGKINTMLLAATGSNVHNCEPEDVTVWSGGNAGVTPVNFEDGENVMALAEHGDAIIAFKKSAKRGLSVVFDDAELAVGLKESNITDSFGAIAGGSVVPTDDGGLMYLSETGIRSYGIQENYALQRTSEGMSRKIGKLIKRINRKAIDRITGIQHEDFIFFAVPLDTAGVNNMLLVYDLEFRGWTVWDIPACAFARFEDAAGLPGLFFVHAYEPALCKLNNEFTDDVGGSNAPIVFDREWKHFSPFALSKWKELEMHLKITVPNTTEIIITTDGIAWPFTITEADIKSQIPLFEGFFGEADGSEAWGGDVDLAAGPKMYNIVIKRELDKTVNQGAECTVRIINELVNQGIDVRRLILRGEYLSFSE